MIKGIYTSAAGMTARIRQQEAVSNNLANVNTTGYKADQRYFRLELDASLMRDRVPQQPAQIPDERLYLHTDFQPGTMLETRNPLDLAIAGSGFFAVEAGGEVSYTRDGSFQLNEDNELVNHRGDRVLGEGGPIRIEGREVAIRDDGEIVVDDRSVGRLLLVDFDKPYQLRRNGYGYFTPAEDTSAHDAADPRLIQGSMEKSNVNPVAEMIKMIELNRSYEASQKAIHAQEETLRMATSELNK